MEIKHRQVVITMSLDEAERLADDMNTIANHLAEVLAKAGDIDTGDPLAPLSDAAYRVDAFRMSIERMRDAR